MRLLPPDDAGHCLLQYSGYAGFAARGDARPTQIGFARALAGLMLAEGFSIPT